MRFIFVLIGIVILSLANSLSGQQCPKPSGLSASDITENSAVLSWESNTEHLDYEVTVKHGSQTSPFNFSTNTSGSSYSISGLEAGSNYKFRVKADCEKGKGVSSWYSFSTPGEAVVDSSGNGNGKGNGKGKDNKCPKVVNMAVLEVTDSTVLLRWHADSNHVDFQVNVKSKNHTPSFKFDTVTTDTFQLVKGLSPGGNYHFRVKAKCDQKSAGSSKWIDFVTTGGDDSTSNQCAKPKNVSILEVTSSSALVQWVHPDSGATFQVDVKSGAHTEAYSNRYETSELSQLIEELKPNSNYQVRIKAFCRDTSTSGSSDWAAFKTSQGEDSTSSDSTMVNPENPDLLNDDVIAIEGESLNSKSENNSEGSLLKSNQSARTKMFPNPTHGQLNIQIPTRFIRDEVLLIITDLSGKIVDQRTIDHMPNGPYALDISSFDPGYYQVTVKSGDYYDERLVYIAK